jgi:activator of HSP90 ATPase
MKKIKQSYYIKAPTSEVWKALVDPKYIDEWGGGPVEMDDKVGTNFKLCGGDIYGTNIKVVPQKKLVQEWYGGKWEKPSIVTFSLSKEKKGTRLDFLQENVPNDDFDDIEQGWKDYYLRPLKEYLDHS